MVMHEMIMNATSGGGQSKSCWSQEHDIHPHLVISLQDGYVLGWSVFGSWMVSICGVSRPILDQCFLIIVSPVAVVVAEFYCCLSSTCLCVQLYFLQRN